MNHYSLPLGPQRRSDRAYVRRDVADRLAERRLVVRIAEVPRESARVLAVLEAEAEALPGLLTSGIYDSTGKGIIYQARYLNATDSLPNPGVE